MRFTNRDLLLVIAVFGLALGYYLERSRNAITRTQLNKLVDTLDTVGVETELAADHVRIKSDVFDAYMSIGKHDPTKPPVMLGAGDGKSLKEN